ncbi:MAG: histidine ammonia-lyase [Dehalococcoidia bacterium]
MMGNQRERVRDRLSSAPPSTADETVSIDGRHLTLQDVVQVARHGGRASLAPSVYDQMEGARHMVEDIVANQQTVYGVTTGFGDLSRTNIPTQDLYRLQQNLVRSHAVGVGPCFSKDVVRATMLLQANMLSLGHSGVSSAVPQLLLDCIANGIHPTIPSQGSVGASGDLAPLAHLALVLIGEGEAEVDGQVLPGKDALERKGLVPLTLGPKEGLALLNGTEVSTAVAALAVHDAETLLTAAIVAGAISVEALRGSAAPFAEVLQNARPYPGQKFVAEQLRYLLRDSEIIESHLGSHKVQDPYSLRCMPQVLGASRDAVVYCRRVIEIELNSATDNPLFFPSEGQVIAGGNFHAQPVALAMDFLKIAASEVGSISERRIYLLLDATRSGLPPFLAKNPGLESGLMIAQNLAASLVSENKVLAHPASVDSIPTSSGMEDHVSMAPIAARQAAQVIENASKVVAVELLAASQGLHLAGSMRPGLCVVAALEMVRGLAEPLDFDRPKSGDIEALTKLVKSGELESLMKPDP